MKLRDYPLLSHHGVKSGPPTWTWIDGPAKKTLKREVEIAVALGQILIRHISKDSDGDVGAAHRVATERISSDGGIIAAVLLLTRAPDPRWQDSFSRSYFVVAK
jgi:hypothetical protein